jgi:hypothetical protein
MTPHHHTQPRALALLALALVVAILPTTSATKTTSANLACWITASLESCATRAPFALAPHLAPFTLGLLAAFLATLGAFALAFVHAPHAPRSATPPRPGPATTRGPPPAPSWARDLLARLHPPAWAFQVLGALGLAAFPVVLRWSFAARVTLASLAAVLVAAIFSHHHAREPNAPATTDRPAGVVAPRKKEAI